MEPPLLDTPAVPVNCQGRPPGSAAEVLAASVGASNPASAIASSTGATATLSTNAVLSSPADAMPSNSTWCVPVVTGKLHDW